MRRRRRRRAPGARRQLALPAAVEIAVAPPEREKRARDFAGDSLQRVFVSVSGVSVVFAKKDLRGGARVRERRGERARVRELSLRGRRAPRDRQSAHRGSAHGDGRAGPAFPPGRQRARRARGRRHRARTRRTRVRRRARPRGRRATRTTGTTNTIGSRETHVPLRLRAAAARAAPDVARAAVGPRRRRASVCVLARLVCVAALAARAGSPAPRPAGDVLRVPQQLLAAGEEKKNRRYKTFGEPEPRDERARRVYLVAVHRVRRRPIRVGNAPRRRLRRRRFFFFSRGASLSLFVGKRKTTTPRLAGRHPGAPRAVRGGGGVFFRRDFCRRRLSFAVRRLCHGRASRRRRRDGRARGPLRVGVPRRGRLRERRGSRQSVWAIGLGVGAPRRHSVRDFSRCFFRRRFFRSVKGRLR
mmetsp:Transcript_12819/g.53719  ORF Transcript_12819/g.53719 Transcript_12819/m.53719 type:complete len:415 (-) Transcript_12819:396-1640(-)